MTFWSQISRRLSSNTKNSQNFLLQKKKCWNKVHDKSAFLFVIPYFLCCQVYLWVGYFYLYCVAFSFSRECRWIQENSFIERKLNGEIETPKIPFSLFFLSILIRTSFLLNLLYVLFSGFARFSARVAATWTVH